DVSQREDLHSTCTSLAACATSIVPLMFSVCCSYVVEIGGREMELEGCQHICVRTFMQPRCCPQHWGLLCLPCPSWSGKTCNFHGNCQDGDVGNGTCVCDEGFAGFACQECKNPNFYGEKCDKACDCEHGVCNQGPEGDGQCLCQPPYTGKRCDQGRTMTCSPYSYCKGEGDAADCECLPGYRKNPQGRCLTHCSGRDCDVNAQCSSQGSKVSCACKPNYQGDGKICVPKNPCSENNGGCPINSTICVFKGPNKSSCECMHGMTPVAGDAAFGCQLVSACSADTCDPTARCQTELDGQPRCVCDAGQIGDGRRCYGNLMERLIELDRSGSQRENLTGAVALFEKGCSLLLSHNGPFTAFFPLLKTPLTVSHLSLVCRNHLILGQHLYKTLEGRDLNLYGGAKLRTKDNKRFILMDNPSRQYNVIQEDLPAANGIIHIIDQPITNTLSDRSPLDEKNSGSPPPLRGPGPLTVFVPTNQAVDRSRDGSFLYMLSDVGVVGIYVLTIDSLAALPRIQTMANQIVTITVSEDGEILLGENGIHLASTNIVASNGIIHMIDGILYPPSILPILPHRCDVTESKIIMGPCVHCSYLYQSECPEGTVEMVNTLVFFCFCFFMVAECCKGFYGPDCKPCIGGFKRPCYDKGTCFDGIHGNGSCSCHSGFKGVACHICSDPNKHGDKCDQDCTCVHGVCDNRPGTNGVCRTDSCLEGYQGSNCDHTLMMCRSTLLDLFITNLCVCCTSCFCKEGYEGDGYSCSAINPCLRSNRGDCDTNAECVYEAPGRASCTCGKGWTGDGRVCVEINNCETDSRGGCSPNANCNHLGPGQSECVCKTGYMGNGNVCDLINPCLKQNGGCHQLAKCEQKESGSHTCTCPDGYAGDGTTCYGSLMDVTTVCSPCCHLAKVTEASIVVPPEYRAASFLHTPFHEIDFLFQTVTNCDEKKDNIILKSFVKLSLFPKFLSETDVLFVCFIVSLFGCGQILAPSPSDLPPEPPTLMAFLNSSSNFTLFRQYALLYNLSNDLGLSDFTLLLPTDDAIRQHLSRTNTSDSDVFKYHVVLNELLFPDHLFDGTLKSTMLGIDYQVMFHLNNDNKTVVNEVPLDGSFIETQTGIIIVLPQVLKVHRNRCSKQITGRCTDCEGPPRCLFSYKPFPANMKSNCRYRKRIGSRRKSVPGCVIKCLKFMTDHSCCPGYYGHECFKCPGDVGSWCSNHGECQDGNNGNGECRCYEGFHGTACEDCEPGRYGVNCSSECVCDHGKCEDGLAGSGRCVCYKGWKGASCSVEIKDDACGGACNENANCITGPKGTAATCVCVAGYVGNGTHCKELDMCSWSNGGCSEFAICTKVSAGMRTCTCKEGYTGDGVVCLDLDGCLVNNGGCHRNADCIRTGPNIVLCVCVCVCVCVCARTQDNGGCSKHARCEYVGNGQRNCTCLRGHLGDGFDCRGSTHNVSHMTSDLSLTSDLQLPPPLTGRIRGLYGDGPFTVFSPVEQTNNDSSVCQWDQSGRLTELVRYHIVSCETLTLADLKTTKLAVSTLGYMLSFSVQQGSVLVNNRSRIVKSDYTTFNGVIHHIDTMLTPYRLQDKPSMNLTSAAAFYGYTRFYKLVEDAGLLPVLRMSIHQPLTMFWPTDKALNSLPAERQRWLSSPDHQDLVAALVKAHIIRNSKVGGGPDRYSSFRTMHGSTIKYSCDKTLVGAVLINENAAKLVERYMNFQEGIAYGIDQLLDLGPRIGSWTEIFSCSIHKQCRDKFNYPPSWFGLDDGFGRRGCKRVCQYTSWVQKCCKNHYSRDCQVCPGGVEAPCSNHGDCEDGLRGSGRCRCHTGFRGAACELCSTGYYGPNCTVCSCGQQGRCDEGIEGSGKCTCKAGWKGDRCEIDIGESSSVTRSDMNPPCDDRFIKHSAAPDLCAEYNGGCHLNADCNQTGLIVNCTCQTGYQGDGYSCQPINRCIEEQNGGCSDFASCMFTGPNQRDCECLPGYVGNGVQCLEKVVPPVDRCLEDNGGCDPVATCKDLHYHANTAGVFHLRSPEGKYKMNFSQAGAACQAEGATLANFKQLGDAQQLGMHLCVAGWMEEGKVGYPTRFPSVKCGDNHVGLVIYKEPVDQSSKYDAYCYRLKDVSCTCPAGYVGNGDFCNGVLSSVLATNSNFSIFYKMLLDYSGSSSDGKQLVDFLSDRTSEVMLFVPHNSGFTQNKVLSKLVNQRLLVDWDILAVNGIIHVIEAPLTAPPAPVSHAHKAGTVSAILVSLVLLCVLAVLGYYVFKHKTDAFRFHYFRNEDEDGATGGRKKPTLVSIPNPLYSGSRAFSEPFGVSRLSNRTTDTLKYHLEDIRIIVHCED
uniref:Stabilin 1 n=1 Tax=Sparus aurata TaxID=8175 RepID=A0A671XZ96_SPAAU